MKTFAIVFAALLALTFGAGTAQAQHVDFGVSIGGRHGGVDIFIGGGHHRHRGPVFRGPVHRGPVYRGPVHRGPIYDNGCYDPCGPSMPSTITVTVWETVSVPEVVYDRYGRQIFTGRYVYRQVQRVVTAWYDPSCGGYVYQDRHGNLVRVR